MAGSTVRRDVATSITTKRLRALAVPSRAAGWCLADRHTGGASHYTAPASNAARLTPPSIGLPLPDRRRLDLVVYGATPIRGALCCDAPLVSPPTQTGQPQPSTAARDGSMLRVAERRKRAAHLSAGGPQRLFVLGSEVGATLERCGTAARSRLGAGPHQHCEPQPLRGGQLWP